MKNIRNINDVYEMPIEEVIVQFDSLSDAYYERVIRVLEAAEGDWANVSDRDLEIINKIEAVLNVMQEKLRDFGLLEDDDDEVANDSDKKEYGYHGTERSEALTNRFFSILEEGGNWTELFLIRDLLLEEYINNRFGHLGILQIDDILEEDLARYLADNEPVIEMCYLDDVVNNIYKAIGCGDLDGAFALTNAYGENAQSNPYIYYCIVRELERITGETYIELCI